MGTRSWPDELQVLAELPGVAAAQERARNACTQLRWHEALRRRTAEAAAESRVRGAQASARLEGADVDLTVVRDRMRGSLAWSPRPDPVEGTLRGAVQATAETERLARLLATAPLQALARLHVGAASPLLTPEQLGRPRRPDEVCRELTDLGTPPAAGSPLALRSLGELILLAGRAAGPGDPLPSALVVCAVVHAELALLRPFIAGNAIVARALERALLQSSGLDPTGVVVPEAGHARGTTAYRGALAAYSSGSPEGVATWIIHCGQVVAVGADEGVRIADAVLAGRLT